MLCRLLLVTMLGLPVCLLAQDGEPVIMIDEQRVVEPEVDPNAILHFVERMPQFPGGMDSLRTYMAHTVQYPEDAKEARISGKVFLQFVVEVDGSLSDIKVIRGAHPSLDREAIRAVRSMPRWEPGMHQGEPRRVMQTLPVIFVAQ